VLTLAFAPVKRAIPGVRLGPAGEAAFRPSGSGGEGAEGSVSRMVGGAGQDGHTAARRAGGRFQP